MYKSYIWFIEANVGNMNTIAWLILCDSGVLLLGIFYGNTQKSNYENKHKQTGSNV